MIEDLVLNKKRFSKMVEKKVSDANLTYIEGCVEVCKDLDMDPSDAKNMLSEPLKKKIEVEAINLRMIKTDSTANTLPL